METCSCWWVPVAGAMGVIFGLVVMALIAYAADGYDDD